MGPLTSRAKRIVNENPAFDRALDVRAVGERRSDEVRFVTGARARAALRPVAMIPIPYALDALNFLAADVRNLFGPFVNVFLVTDRIGARPMSGS